jgi:dsRNA-specific ribonuclease
MSLIRPDLQGTNAPREAVREEVERGLAKRREKTQEYMARRKERMEEKKSLAPVKVETYEFTHHAWVPFAGSPAMEALRMKALESALSSTSIESKDLSKGVTGYAPSRREKKGWSAELKRHILNTLVPVFEGDEGFGREDLSRMYDPVSDTWQSAFTNFSSDPNEGKNYEQGEKIGDSAAKLGLQDTMIDARPTITEHELTVAVNTILAKEQQATVSEALGFPPLMRTNYPDVNTDEAEDLFESFVGALYVMGNRESLGLGVIMVSRFLWYLDSIDLIDITDETYDTPPKTQISILFRSLGWGQPLEAVVREKDVWRARVLIEGEVRRTAVKRTYYMLDIYDAKAHIDEGKEYQPIPQQHITSLMAGGEAGNATGATEAKAIYNAYKNAVDRLKKMGIIREATFLEHFRLNQDFDRINEESYAKAYLRAKGEGYDNIFSTDAKIRYDKTKTTGYINLIGIRRLAPRERTPLQEYIREVIYTVAIPVMRDRPGIIQVTGQGNQTKYDYDKREVRRLLYELYAKDRRTLSSEPTEAQSYGEGLDDVEEEGEEGEEVDE